MPHELTESQKVVILKCCLLLFYATAKNHFLLRLWRVRKSGFFLWQPAITNTVAAWEEAPKHFPKPDLHQNGHGHCLVVCCPSWSTTAFWIPVKPLHMRCMLSKSMRCPQSCNACSRHWSIERAPFFSMATPDCISHNQCFKSWMNWATKFCLICHIHLTSRQEAENALQEYVESQSTGFYATRVNKLISHCKKSVRYNDSYFD